MARTYLSTENSRGTLVTAMSAPWTHIRGWDCGVYVDFRPDGKTDRWNVYMTAGSNGYRKVYLGAVWETEEGPVWIPADAVSTS